MKIDDTIKDAIQKAVEETGGQSALARITGISSQNICRYLSGQIKDLSAASFARLWNQIKKYLPENYEETHMAEIEAISLALEEHNAKQLKINPLLKIGIQCEAERRATEDLIENERYKISGKPSGNMEFLEIQHANELLKLKLKHAEREKELMQQIIDLTKQLSEKRD